QQRLAEVRVAGDGDGSAGWDVRRAVVERRKRNAAVLDAHADAERRCAGLAPAPALPDAERLDQLAAGLGFVLDPDELQVGVFEEESTVGRALALMAARAAFQKARFDQRIGLRGAGRGPDQHVVQREAHPATSISTVAARRAIVAAVSCAARRPISCSTPSSRLAPDSAASKTVTACSSLFEMSLIARNGTPNNAQIWASAAASMSSQSVWCVA